MAGMDPTTDLVRNAIGCGVMMALDDKGELLAMLMRNPDGTLADALTDEAERFCRTRADLVEALKR